LPAPVKKAALLLAMAVLLAHVASTREWSHSSSSSTCYLQSSFTPSDDLTSLSLDMFKVQARGGTSSQYPVWVALAHNNLIQQGYFTPQGVVGLQVISPCEKAIESVRQRLAIAEPAPSGAVGGRQLTEINEHWALISAAAFNRGAPPPVAAPH